MNNYKVVYSDDYLEHHGILGQKWGVRRYQNSDGSLTPAGAKRYGVDTGESSNNSQNSHKGLSEEQRKHLKKVAIGSAIVAGTLAAGFAAYKINSLSGINKDYVIKGGQIIQRISPETTLHNEFFAAVNKHDAARYQGLMKGHFVDRGGYKLSDVKVHKMKLGNDMKIASKKSAEKIYEDLIKNDQSFSKYAKDFWGQKLSYKDFNEHLVGDVHARPEVQKFYSQLKKAGYSGLIDLNDKVHNGKGFGARKPTIIIDAKNIVDHTVSNYDFKPSQKNKEMGKMMFEQLADVYDTKMLLAAAGSGTVSVSAFRELNKDNKVKGKSK